MGRMSCTRKWIETRADAPTEGTLQVRIDVANQRVVHVEIASTRPSRVTRVLSGRTPEDAARLTPMLFPLCGMAHAVALWRAVDSARGCAVSQRLDVGREIVCLAEAAASHVWQVALAWPAACAARRDDASVHTARQLAERASVSLFGTQNIPVRLAENPSWSEARRAASALAELVSESVAKSAHLLEAVRAAGRAGFGRSFAETSPVPSCAAIGRLLAADPEFADRPEIDGLPVDMSALARQGSMERVRAVETSHGLGLLARLVARQVDALCGARRLGSLAAEAERLPEEARRATSTGEGVGEASTGRGPLVYWVRTRLGAVDDVRVVAPTDWMLHPRGTLAQALVGVEATPTLERDAGWLVLALDPCVPWSVEVRDA
jgi:Ni,Fe-hydrogenase I large subunit